MELEPKARNRTRNRLVTSQALCHLSYMGMMKTGCGWRARTAGLRRVKAALSQLS